MLLNQLNLDVNHATKCEFTWPLSLKEVIKAFEDFMNQKLLYEVELMCHGNFYHEYNQYLQN